MLKKNGPKLHTVRGPIKLPRLKLHFVEISKMTLKKHWEISPN